MTIDDSSSKDMTEEIYQPFSALTIDADVSGAHDASHHNAHPLNGGSKTTNRSSAVTSNKDSYVVVLIDPHSHRFENKLFEAEGGGVQAAELLEQAVRDVIGPNGLHIEVSRIAIRVFADLASLYKHGVRPGRGKRDEREKSEAFFADMSQRSPDFDMTDMQSECGVETKLMEAFEAYANDPGCAHIFFAGWRRPSYFAVLAAKPEKVTLVLGYGMAPGLERILILNTTRFEEVFVQPKGRDIFRLNYSPGHGAWICPSSVHGNCDNFDCELPHLPNYSIIEPNHKAWRNTASRSSVTSDQAD
ncbi:hypothetical protein EJ02DRAFT_455888 [Clathrospora elynae]|uniref:DUF7923 domain-containing protein n=1 Tax=Clathrospora elynae TaxID=706981 RepID=A0A6A5SKA1_9PLEO|nr:hypothetical protein EJ02DRAFT_455888 [Clathrospora elynae]